MNKTDKVNYNATTKYATNLLNTSSNEVPNVRKRMNLKAFGLLLKICLKTGIRTSDLLNLEYTQFEENRSAPNTFTLKYYITKTSKTNEVPIGAELKRLIEIYKMECLKEFGYSAEKIFWNYSTKKIYTRVWASKKVADANDKGLLGPVVNCAGMHSVRRSAVVEVFEKTQDLRLAQSFLGHKNILTTSNYLADQKKTTQDRLREVLC